MKLRSAFSILSWLAIFVLLLPVTANSVDIATVAVNNTRQGWNQFETVLTPANVPKLKKIREFMVDEKIDVSPLVVGNKLYVFTMSNTAFVFDVITGVKLVERQLGTPFDPCANPAQMDKFCMYKKWGITATPVIDVATNTVYVTTFGKSTPGGQNHIRDNMLWILDGNTLNNKVPAIRIEGNADNGGGGIANGNCDPGVKPCQKMRAGLGLLTDVGGSKALIVSFSINGENPNGPGHGFVVAYDVRGLMREAGFTPTPAIWNVTPDGGAGGIWMSGSGPAIDGNDIYLATGNGMDPGRKPNNYAESFVKLRYTAGIANQENGKPKLAVADHWGAFSDFNRKFDDQDLGSAGVFIIPARGNLIGGGKDGILYNLNKDNLGKNSWAPHFNLPFVATYLPNPPNGAAGLPTTTQLDPNWPIVNLDRNVAPNGKTFHIHGSPVYLEDKNGGIIYLWGENETLKCYNYDFTSKRVTAFRAEGQIKASGNEAGMPGGRMVVSSNGTLANTGVVWGVYPMQGDANAKETAGALVAFDATKIGNGNKLNQLFHSETKLANHMGIFAKYSTPVVANGKVYVGTFSKKVVQYGL